MSKYIGHSISAYLLAYFLCLGITGSAMQGFVASAKPGVSSKFSDAHYAMQVISNQENVSLLFDNSFEETEEIQEENHRQLPRKYVIDFECYEQFLLSISEKIMSEGHVPQYTNCNVPIYILFHSWMGYLH